MRRAVVTPLRRDVGYWISHSEVFVSVDMTGGTLNRVHIEFHGECSRIPSLKNSKIPGKNFLNPETLNRLRAMDALYLRASAPWDRKRLCFGDRQVVGLLIMGKRKVRFDLDNCAAAVKDWLEPPTTRGRGWGVGLIDNDAALTIFPVHSNHLGKTTAHTTLVLQPWDHVGPSFKTWAERMFF